MSFLEIANECIARGWYVFPCKPKSKTPLVRSGFKDASLDPEQVKIWWTLWPTANVAIATGASGLCVVDIDHGIANADELDVTVKDLGLTETYAVRTGRRPEFGVQLYYEGVGLKSTGWERDGLKGDIRCSTGYVMAAGSIHPDSGLPYEVLWTGTPNFVPDTVKSLTTKAQEFDPSNAVDDNKADEWKTYLFEYAHHHGIAVNGFEKRAPNGWWLGIVCPWLAEHTSGAGAESSTVLGVLDGKVVFECSHGTCKAKRRDTAALKSWARETGDEFEPEPGADPVVTLGSATGLPAPTAKPDEKPDPEAWRALFHTRDEMENAPPLSFLIDGFLQREGVTAIAAPVRERKTFVALNIVHSLLTGEALFGKFPVVKRPSRVLYLVPELSLGPFTHRLRALGLIQFEEETLFCRTLSKDGHLKLNDPLLLPALPGSVVFLDTAIRFYEGQENDSQDARKFADTIFALLKAGAEAVVILHHSPKADTDSMTLENALRGSGDLGAFLAACWGTRLQDPAHPYDSHSFLSLLKQRDFEATDFEVSCARDSGKMTFMESDGAVTLNRRRRGNVADKDGMDEAAIAMIQAHPELSGRAMAALLKEHGIKRGRDWVDRKKTEAGGRGVKISSA